MFDSQFGFAEFLDMVLYWQETQHRTAVTGLNAVVAVPSCSLSISPYRFLEPADVVRLVDDAHIGFIVLDLCSQGSSKNTSLLEESELRSFWIVFVLLTLKNI